jgi:FSR family fosmidomycin resistance protein-like MFS transporter
VSEAADQEAGIERPGRAVAALAIAHGANDLYMGFLPALLPLIVERLGLSLTLAGGLVSVVNLASQLTQPILGHSADRIGRRLLVIIGPLITTLAMASLGLMTSYQALLIALLLGSFGNSAFHPQGAALAGKIGALRRAADSTAQRSGAAMAIFAAGGNIGYGLGPVLVIAVVNHLGQQFTWLTIPVGLAAVAFLIASLPAAVDTPSHDASADPSAANRTWLRPLIILWLVVALRAAAAIIFTTFVPLLISRRHEPLMLGGWALLGFSLAGALGGLIGGPASDRLGRRSVTIVTMLLAAPAYFLFLHAHGVASAVLLVATGACLFAGLPVNLVMAQELLPRRASLVSGLMMGLAWAAGGLSTTVVGALADRLAVTLGPAGGLERAMDGTALVCIAAAALAVLLPETRRNA